MHFVATSLRPKRRQSGGRLGSKWLQLVMQVGRLVPGMHHWMNFHRCLGNVSTMLPTFAAIELELERSLGRVLATIALMEPGLPAPAPVRLELRHVATAVVRFSGLAAFPVLTSSTSAATSAGGTSGECAGHGWMQGGTTLWKCESPTSWNRGSARV